MKKRSILFIMLLLIVSFLITSVFIDRVSANSTDNLKYEFKKNILFDDSVSLNKDIINLRHNNIMTKDYKGTYSFNNTIGSIPIGWNNLSEGNGNCFIQENLKNHDKILKLSVIDADNSKIEQIFVDGNQESGIIEFWFSSSNCIYINNFQIVSGGTIGVFFRIYNDKFQYANGGWQDLDIIPLDNIWYHIKFDFNCITDKTDIYINDYYEGNYDFINPLNNFDRIWFENVDTAVYNSFVDAIGYSWSSNYTIGLNKYPIIKSVDSNILTPDMYQFNFDSDGNPYSWEDTNIVGWTTIASPDYCFIDIPAIHYYYHNPSESIKNKNALSIIGYASGSGIMNNTINLYGDKINITFGINFKSIDPTIQHHVSFIIRSTDNTEIISLRFLPIYASEEHSNDIVDLQYYDGSIFHDLVRFHKVKDYDVYNFNLYLENHNVDLRWSKNDVYNNTYSFPFISNKSGVDRITFLCFDSVADSNYLFIRLSYIGIYQYNISHTKEFGCLRYIFSNYWNFDTYNLFKIISDTYGRILTTVYSIDAFLKNIRTLNNETILHNTYGQTIRNYVHLWLITNISFIINEILFTIEGIRLEKYINNVFSREITIQYYYHNLNINQSYYYIDDSNRLHYQFDITQNDTLEYMILYFDFLSGISSNNMSIYFKCREISLSIGYPYIAMTYYQPPDNHFDLETYPITINTLLNEGNEFRRFHFVITDQNNNNYTNYISEGYIYGLEFNYIPSDIFPIPFISLSFINVIIVMIILIIPTLAIYGVYKKKEIILPLLLLMSIICFISELIPLQLFFIIIIALISGVFLQYKIKKSN